MRARRALLFTSRSALRQPHTAAALDVDCLCMDMEDGGAANQKAQTRLQAILFKPEHHLFVGTILAP